jgi:hypothetical protein
MDATSCCEMAASDEGSGGQSSPIGPVLPAGDGAMVTRPVSQRPKPPGALSYQAGLLQRPEMLEDGALRHATPTRQFNHDDLIGPMIRHVSRTIDVALWAGAVWLLAFGKNAPGQ